MKDTALSRDHDQLESDAVGSEELLGGKTSTHSSYKNIAAKELDNLIHGHPDPNKHTAVQTPRSQVDRKLPEGCRTSQERICFLLTVVPLALFFRCRYYLYGQEVQEG